MAMNTELKLLNDIEKDLDWFQYNYNNILDNHNNKFIAIKNKRIISSADDMPTLINKLKQIKEDPSKILIRFVSKIKMIL